MHSKMTQLFQVSNIFTLTVQHYFALRKFIKVLSDLIL